MAIDIVGSPGLKDLTPGVDMLNDFWSNRASLFKNKRLGEGTFTISHRYKSNVNEKEKQWYGLVDEARKININFSSQKELEKLLMNVGELDGDQARQLTEAIIDWRDSDDVVGRDEALSERIAYLGAGFSYMPRNAPFRILEELLLVKDMNIVTFVKIRNYLTVFGSGLININTVSKQILECIGCNPILADKIISFRAGLDMQEGTSDDNTFDSPEEIIEKLTSYTDLYSNDKAIIADLISQGRISVYSDTFTAVCVSNLERKEMYGRIICVFDKAGNIKYWGSR